MFNLILTLIGTVLFLGFVYWLRRRLGFRRVEAEDQLLSQSHSAQYSGRP